MGEKMPIPTDPETMLPRAEGAATLTEAGFPIAPATLATKASRGGGPPFVKFNGRVLYRWGDLLAWAQAQTSPPQHSTASARAA